MVIILRSRDELLQELEAPERTLLLLSGTARSTSKLIHDTSEQQNPEPWRATVWLKNLTELDVRERAWLPEKDRFAVLSITEAGPVLVQSGATSELLRGARPSVLRIRLAFARGDQHES